MKSFNFPFFAVIGAWENTRTAIRKRANDYPDLTNEMTIDLLGKDVPVNVLFTISKCK